MWRHNNEWQHTQQRNGDCNKNAFNRENNDNFQPNAWLPFQPVSLFLHLSLSRSVSSLTWPVLFACSVAKKYQMNEMIRTMRNMITLIQSTNCCSHSCLSFSLYTSLSFSFSVSLLLSLLSCPLLATDTIWNVWTRREERKEKMATASLCVMHKHTNTNTDIDTHTCNWVLADILKSV